MLPLILASSAGTFIGFLIAIPFASIGVSALVGVAIGLVCCALAAAWMARVAKQRASGTARNLPPLTADFARDRVA
jgi:hypothetical protein